MNQALDQQLWAADLKILYNSSSEKPYVAYVVCGLQDYVDTVLYHESIFLVYIVADRQEHYLPITR